MTRTLQYTSEITVLNCAECGIPFGITPDFESRRRKDHHWFHCPSGHNNRYTGETDEEKELRKLRADRDWYQKRCQDESQRADHNERRANGLKGALAKANRRAKAGMCPCCNRSFVELARHIRTQHPDFDPDAAGSDT